VGVGGLSPALNLSISTSEPHPLGKSQNPAAHRVATPLMRPGYDTYLSRCHSPCKSINRSPMFGYNGSYHRNLLVMCTNKCTYMCWATGLTIGMYTHQQDLSLRI
jgi:hypothetical protein